jgi:hypothetical protein
MNLDLICDPLLKGQVIPFLGAGVNLCGQKLEGAWHPATGQAPSGLDLAKHLAGKHDYPKDENNVDLLRVSQYVEVKSTEGTLYRALHDVFDRDFPMTPVHRFLASFPALRRSKGFKDRYQVILTTNYDDILERAFRRQDQPFDVLTYDARTKSSSFGKFWHRSWDDKIDQVITSPNEYQGLLGDRTVILKIHGAIERRNEEGTEDSYVISEDHYIDYMAHERTLNRFPIPIKEKLIANSFLFLGYSLRDWNMRILWRQIWKDQKLEQQSWAVAEKIETVDRLFWSKRDVAIIDADLAGFVQNLEEKIQAMPAAGARS